MRCAEVENVAQILLSTVLHMFLR